MRRNLCGSGKRNKKKTLAGIGEGVIIFIRGKDSLTTETEDIVAYLKTKVPNIELYEIDGQQDIYSYILILE